MVFFAVHMLLRFIMSHLFLFGLHFMILRDVFFLIAVIYVRACSVYIFLKSFIVSALTFRSLKYLEGFLVCILLESILISFSFSLFQEPSHCPL